MKQDILDFIDERIEYLNRVSGTDTIRVNELERVRAFVEAQEEA